MLTLIFNSQIHHQISPSQEALRGGCLADHALLSVAEAAKLSSICVYVERQTPMGWERRPQHMA